MTIDLDGSAGEGGGQILRTSLALSLLTGKAFHVRHLRGRRPKPGLQPQHLKGVQAAATIGNAAVRGASLGSTDLTFEPGTVKGGRYQFDIGTAGSTGLLLHALYLPLALRAAQPVELELVGGTHVTTSPTFHFLDSTWRAYLGLMYLSLRLRMVRPGFYPRGGGMVQVFIQPCESLQGITLPGRGEIMATGFSAVAGLDRQIARRQARRAAQRLKRHDLEVNFDEQTWDGGPGSVLFVQLDTHPVPTTFTALGARGKPAEAVADELADEVIRYLEGGPSLVDEHSADQIVLPLALAQGPSEYSVTRVTQHLLTNIGVIQQFIKRPIVCEGEEGQSGRVIIS